jgi:Fic family protein
LKMKPRDRDPDLMRHGGNRESIEAHESIREFKQRVRRAIFKLAKKRRRRGITADEVAAEWGSSHNHVAPRITELKAAGLLVPTAERRKTRAGRWARVLVVNRKAA